MPPLEQTDRHQKALLWAATGNHDSNGRRYVSAPVDVKVRWNLKRKEMLLPDGTTVAVDATAVVDRDVAVGSEMWLAPDQGPGSDDASEQWYGGSPGSGGADDEVMQVVAFDRALDLKGRVARREVGLMKSKDGPSTIDPG